MVLTLDPATEKRIQRELARGVYREPTEVISRALDLLDAEREERAGRRAEIVASLEESVAQADRGEGFTQEEVRARIAARRHAHQQGQPA